jgi:hypothetical protein
MSSPVIKACRKAVEMSLFETSHPNATESVKRSFKVVRLGVLAKLIRIVNHVIKITDNKFATHCAIRLASLHPMRGNGMRKVVFTQSFNRHF